MEPFVRELIRTSSELLLIDLVVCASIPTPTVVVHNLWLGAGVMSLHAQTVTRAPQWDWEFKAVPVYGTTFVQV